MFIEETKLWGTNRLRASKLNASMVLITNHLGDCDAELERSYFLTNSISFDDKTLVATASTQAANISTVASKLPSLRYTDNY